MTKDSKGIPLDVPAPKPLGKEGEDAEMTNKQIDALLSGAQSFQDYFKISDQALLSWAKQGYFFYSQGKFPEAEVVFKGLVALNTNVSYYHTALGAVLEAQEKHDEAVEQFNFALKQNENDICALVNRGEIMLKKGKIIEAAQDFRRGIEIDEKKIAELEESGEEKKPSP